MEQKGKDNSPDISDDVDTHRAISIHLSTDSALASFSATPVPNPYIDPPEYSFPVSWIRPYFTASEGEIISKIKLCLFPQPVPQQLLMKQADLYGPFWIVATLCVSFSLFGNISRYLFNIHSDVAFRVQLIHKAIVILYGFWLIVPLSLSLAGRGLGFALDPVEAVSLYGYSLSSALMVSVLCILPSSVLQCILMGYAFVTSCALLVQNLRHALSELDETLKYGILGCVCLCQVGLFVSIKVVFLNLAA